MKILILLFFLHFSFLTFAKESQKNLVEDLRALQEQILNNDITKGAVFVEKAKIFFKSKEQNLKYSFKLLDYFPLVPGLKREYSDMPTWEKEIKKITKVIKEKNGDYLLEVQTKGKPIEQKIWFLGKNIFKITNNSIIKESSENDFGKVLMKVVKLNPSKFNLKSSDLEGSLAEDEKEICLKSPFSLNSYWYYFNRHFRHGETLSITKKIVAIEEVKTNFGIIKNCLKVEIDTKAKFLENSNSYEWYCPFIGLTKTFITIKNKKDPQYKPENDRILEKQYLEIKKYSYEKVTEEDSKEGKNEFISIDQGCFKMGNNKEKDDERPVHEVCLKPFKIQKYEVSVKEYKKCVEAMLCTPPTSCDYGTPNFSNKKKSDHPVVCVSWQLAKDYCEWIGGDLPTAAQWEYAARGTDGRKYPWGNVEPSTKANDLANCDEGDCFDKYPKTSPVGSFEKGKSPFGLYDMAGNVLEWVQDWYDEKFYERSVMYDPINLEVNVARVLRGGSWSNQGNDIRSSKQTPEYPNGRLDYYGFRCARK